MTASTNRHSRSTNEHSNQRQRTRTAIVAAARSLLTSGEAVTMPAVAARALVSDATAYRYFPDLASLLSEAFTVTWDSPDTAMAAVAASPDPVERVTTAVEVLLRDVWACQGAVRSVMAVAITRPEASGIRPWRRFGLIDVALAPLQDTLARTHPGHVEELRRALAVAVSAEALFILTDACGLSVDDATRSVVHIARALTAHALANVPGRPETAPAPPPQDP